ncbi:WW domain containing E3 ubiquitin protein ligase 1 [Varicellaria rhodocarpa]|nr:WW domain containing E3 ubiquitin protein ligase 1 [Varicellaria rhodocarpa]
MASNSQPPETTTVQNPRLPSHIETAVDSSGRTYYVNHQIRETSWINPLTINRMDNDTEDRQRQQGAMQEDSPLPSHIERKVNPNGRTYYVDHQTRKTSWWNPLHPTDQDGFPNHIERKIDFKGRSYFADHESKKTNRLNPLMIDKANAIENPDRRKRREWTADKTKVYIVDYVKDDVSEPEIHDGHVSEEGEWME